MIELKEQVAVEITKDYSKFKFLKGNRETNKLHLARLKESMTKKPLITIIIVNEKHEIIDGQHRFHVSKELRLPLYYMVMHGYGLDEVQILNQNNKKWSPNDYVDGYCDLGYKEYITYRAFYKAYHFGYQVNHDLLTGGHHGKSDTIDFNNGYFKVIDLKRATLWADRIMTLGDYFEKNTQRAFVQAMIHAFKKRDFNFDDFLHKLTLRAVLLRGCGTVQQYKDAIHEIYNFKRSKRVNLRF